MWVLWGVVAMANEHRGLPRAARPGASPHGLREAGEGGDWGGYCVVQTPYFRKKIKKMEKKNLKNEKINFKPV